MASPDTAYHPRLQERYRAEIVPALNERFGYSSVMQVPRLTKITLNMGVGEAKQNSKVLDEAVEHLTLIAGQKPVITKAKRSIAGFKLREGMPIGCKVTLRDARMWEFLDRLTSIALPARARLPRRLARQLRRARQLQPRGFASRRSSPRSTTTGSTSRAVST